MSNNYEEDEEITITVEYQNKVTEHLVADIEIPKSIQGDKAAIRQFIQENEHELYNQNLEKTYTTESLIDLEI